MNDNYHLLIRKLDEFIRKYYINQLIRGAIYASALLLAAFLVIDVLEYYSYFSSLVRSILFFGFLCGASFIIVQWLILPLIHYFQLGKIISHEKAAGIIGSHFSEVEDRLLNILQLKRLSGDVKDASLIQASIDQKIITLKPVPFTSAINLSLNKKNLRYLVLPVMAFAFILFSSPDIIKDSTFRLIHNQEYFERKAPFQFSILNNKLQTVQYQDFIVDVKVQGELMPNDAFININGFEYPLSKKNAANFNYTIVKPQNDVHFYFSSGAFRSKDYSLKVLPKPIIVKFSSELIYPLYTRKKNETMQNMGDFTVPQGTRINWNFISQNTSKIDIALSDSIYVTEHTGDQFYFTKRLLKDAPYTLFISNEDLPNADSIRYSITVIPDRYPAIQVNQTEDSTERKYLYFAGAASDDYGLRNLYLKYKIEKEGAENTGIGYQSVPVKISNGKEIQFSQFWDLSTVSLEPGDRLVYFFEAWDNDAVNGSKFTRSSFMTYKLPSKKEMEQKTDENNEAIKNQLENSMKEADDLHDQYEKLQNDLLNKKNPSWEDKKKIEDLLQQQKNLTNKIESLQKTFKENISNQDGYKKYNEELKQKQDELHKLFDNVLNPEMKEMMQKLQDLLEQLNKDKTLDQLQNQKVSNDELKKELDRMLSLFKQLEFEQKLNDTKNQLDSLSRREDQLSKKNELSEKSNKDSLSNKQKDIQNDFTDVQKQLDKLDSLNKQLDSPNDMPDTKQEQQQTQQEMQNAQQNMQKNNSKKASQNQKNAADQMEKMSDKIQQAQQSMEMQQNEMDMQATRQILENLIKVSFDQEELINKTKGVNIYNPQYLQIMKSQHDLADDLSMVEDSIQQLSKRVYQIQSFVNEQVSDINKNLDRAIQTLEARQPLVAASSQQYIMTSVNNLALMFEEIMQQMQQQQASKMAGTQMCQKPGGSKQSMQSMRQMQGQLNDQIKQLSQQMQNGKMPNGKTPGQNEGMNQQLAQMAAKQAAIRDALRQANEELNKDGKNSLGDLDQLQKDMDKTETELLNKQVTAEMQQRQQEILTRLLEAENAERQRETDKQRESNAGKDMVKKMPPEIEDYLKKRQAELELYKTVPPSLKPFYRDLVEEYIKALQQ
ncbi:MAG: DUF4175 domain-containing protein [Chitinophagales bacterium]|nr:DUF4175 domain-containing protein [Chitinophagales bacterium]